MGWCAQFGNNAKYEIHLFHPLLRRSLLQAENTQRLRYQIHLTWTCRRGMQHGVRGRLTSVSGAIIRLFISVKCLRALLQSRDTCASNKTPTTNKTLRYANQVAMQTCPIMFWVCWKKNSKFTCWTVCFVPSERLCLAHMGGSLLGMSIFLDFAIRKGRRKYDLCRGSRITVRYLRCWLAVVKSTDTLKCIISKSSRAHVVSRDEIHK